MANKKFSQFTAGAAYNPTNDGLGRIAGFTTGTTINNIWTPDEVALGLSLITSTPYSIYASDGSLSTARTLSMDGNNLTIDGGSSVYPTFQIGDGITLFPNGQTSGAYPLENSMFIRGSIEFPYYGASTQGLKWASYNTSVRAYGFSLYGGGAWSHYQGNSVIGPDFDFSSGGDLNARLGVIGKDNDDTSYAFRVQNSDLTDIFSLNNAGTFTLGLGASTSTASGIAIGANASSTATSGIAIGAMTSHVTTAGLHSIAMGGSTRAAGSYSVAIGYNCGSNSTSVNSCVNIGSSAQGDGANSITLSATDAGDVVPSTAKAFGVYMSGKTTPDFEVVGNGESTLNTSLKITGQAYTELHTNATNLVVDWNDGNVQAVTISGSAPTFAPTNPKAGATYILTLTQGATPVTVDFNSLVKWSGGAPTLSSTTGQIDVITLICYNDSGAGLYYGAATLDLA